MRFGIPIFLVVIVTAALAVRLSGIERRPMHVDEAVQASITGELLETGIYRYNPIEFHGPTLYYFTLPILKLCGLRDFASSRELHYRLVPLIASLALILMLGGLRAPLGGAGLLAAAMLLAVSPSMTYYSRHYVQEMLLLAFIGGLLVALWRWLARESRWAAFVAGLCAGLAFATKETCVFAFSSLLVGSLIAAWSIRASLPTATFLPGAHQRHLLLAACGFFLAWLLFFSSFFTHWRGLLDSWIAFGIYVSRAAGDGSTGNHDHPIHFYLQRLAWWRRPGFPIFSEATILILAAIGVGSAYGRASLGALDAASIKILFFRRALAAYAALLTLTYSIIPYKTPWLLLNFLHPLILLAGLGASFLWERARRPLPRMALVLSAALAVSHLAWQSGLAIGRYEVDPHNPYVYAQAGSDFRKLVSRLDQLRAAIPERPLTVKVFGPEYWPLPWSLRAWPRVGYWNALQPGLPRGDASEDILIVDSELGPEVEARLDGHYIGEFYQLRPGVFLSLYIKPSVWRRMLDRVEGPTAGGERQ